MINQTPLKYLPLQLHIIASGSWIIKAPITYEDM